MRDETGGRWAAEAGRGFMAESGGLCLGEKEKEKTWTDWVDTFDLRGVYDGQTTSTLKEL